MKTLRELAINHPLMLSRVRPEWTVRIRKGQPGFLVSVVDAKDGTILRKTGIRRLEGTSLAETLHLIAEAEQTTPAVIHCGCAECFRHSAFENWAVYHTITLSYGPVAKYMGRRIRPAKKGIERPPAPTEE